MTNKSISQLTAGAAVSSTDIFPDVQTSGVGPVKVTAAQIGDYILGNQTNKYSANFAFNGTTLTLANDISVNGQTIGEGGGAVATNTAHGVSALGANTTGSLNTAVGYQALSANQTNTANTAVGFQSSLNSRGNNNTTVGYLAGSQVASSSGGGNVFVGWSVGKAITTGNVNTIVGGANATGAGVKLTTGSNNTGFGTDTLAECQTNSNNTAVGYQSLFKATADSLTAVGYQALQANTTGANNIAVGTVALYNNTTGTQNTALGNEAGYTISTASNLTAVGNQALYSATGASNTAIGQYAGRNVSTGTNNSFLGQASGTDALVNVTTASNVVVLGNNSTATLYCKTSTITTSDIRDKIITGGVPYGLSFVNALNPIEYKFRKERGLDTPNDGEPNRYGFSAQEILALEGDNPTIIDAHDPENLKIAGAHLIPVLVNAIKELSAEIEELKKRVK